LGGKEKQLGALRRCVWWLTDSVIYLSVAVRGTQDLAAGLFMSLLPTLWLQ